MDFEAGKSINISQKLQARSEISSDIITIGATIMAIVIVVVALVVIMVITKLVRFKVFITGWIRMNIVIMPKRSKNSTIFLTKIICSGSTVYSQSDREQKTEV